MVKRGRDYIESLAKELWEIKDNIKTQFLLIPLLKGERGGI
jgi:hypothetical protein